MDCPVLPSCRRAADAFNQRRLQRRHRATLCAWRDAAAARRYLRAQGAHAKALLERRLLGRVLAGWRRAALAGKLCHTLEVVRQLQGAVERVSQELQRKAQQASVWVECGVVCRPSRVLVAWTG